MTLIITPEQNKPPISPSIYIYRNINYYYYYSLSFLSNPNNNCSQLFLILKINLLKLFLISQMSFNATMNPN